jgi:hypothetical protein
MRVWQSSGEARNRKGDSAWRLCILCSLGLFFVLFRLWIAYVRLPRSLADSHRTATSPCTLSLLRFPDLHALLQLGYSVTLIRSRIAAVARACLVSTSGFNENDRRCNEWPLEPLEGLQLRCAETWPLVSTWKQVIADEWLQAQALAYGERNQSSRPAPEARTTPLQLRMVDHCHTTAGIRPRSLDELTSVLACTGSQSMKEAQRPLLQYSQTVFGLSCCQAVAPSCEHRHSLIALIRRRYPQTVVVCCFDHQQT